MAPSTVALRQQVRSEMFEMGVCYASPMALRALKQNSLSPRDMLRCYAAGDWGEVRGRQARRNRRFIQRPGWRRVGRRLGWRIEALYPLEDVEILVYTEPGGERTSLFTVAELVEESRRRARSHGEYRAYRRARAERWRKPLSLILGVIVKAALKAWVAVVLVVAAVLLSREAAETLAWPEAGISAADIQVVLVVGAALVFLRLMFGSLWARRSRGGRGRYRYKRRR